MTQRALSCLLLFLVVGAASAESISFSCSGADCSLAARWPWEAVVSASLSVSSTNLSAANITANGTEVWNGSGRGNVTGTIVGTSIDSEYPDYYYGSPGTTPAGMIGSKFGTGYRYRSVMPPGGAGSWIPLTPKYAGQSWGFWVTAHDALAPINVRNLSWNNSPAWSPAYWRGWLDPNLAPLWVPLAANGTMLRQENDSDMFAGYFDIYLRTDWTALPPAAGTAAVSLGASSFPLNIAGENLSVSGWVETDAAWVTGYATVEGQQVAATFALNGSVNYTLQTGANVSVKRGTYTANALRAGLQCSSGAFSLTVSANATFTCVIIGSPPNPVNQPVFSAGGGGGGGGGAPPAAPAATSAPSPISQPSGGGAGGEGPVSLVTPLPACSPGSLALNNSSGTLISTRCRADGSGWDPETNFTAEERSFAVEQLNRSGYAVPVPSPGFEAVFAVFGILIAARFAWRRHG